MNSALFLLYTVAVWFSPFLAVGAAITCFIELARSAREAAENRDRAGTTWVTWLWLAALLTFGGGSAAYAWWFFGIVLTSGK